MKSNTKVSKEVLKMQRIAGILTEGEYQDASYNEQDDMSNDDLIGKKFYVMDDEYTTSGFGSTTEWWIVIGRGSKPGYYKCEPVDPKVKASYGSLSPKEFREDYIREHLAIEK